MHPKIYILIKQSFFCIISQFHEHKTKTTRISTILIDEIYCHEFFFIYVKVFIGTDPKNRNHWYPKSMWEYLMSKSKSADKLCLELINYLWAAEELSKRSISARKINEMSQKTKFSPDEVAILEGKT